jgi:hypothetical protein
MHGHTLLGRETTEKFNPSVITGVETIKFTAKRFSNSRSKEKKEKSFGPNQTNFLVTILIRRLQIRFSLLFVSRK